MSRPTCVIGFLGSNLDARGGTRWSRWRPTIGLCQQPDLRVDRLVLLYRTPHTALANQVVADIAEVSPETRVDLRCLDFDDPWNFEEVYGRLLDFARAYPFQPDREDYLIHITTGTHVAQICLFLLTEARFMPGRLAQTFPETDGRGGGRGKWAAIDLDLSQYDSIARRFTEAAQADASFLKSGIATRNPAFNRLIADIETVVLGSRAPILLTGPTGAGKTQLARRIYALKKLKHQVSGAFVEVNCATLRGDGAMSALFGHRRGAFTGAIQDRPGLLRTADKGLLFLDEIGELGLDEQAMMLRALEERRFLPVGADLEVGSEFQLIAGTNRDLGAAVAAGRFREDLYARLNLWTFRLPGLADRREDIEPNLAYEVARFAEREGRSLRFTREAEARYLRFALSDGARWTGNFRDLAASLTRMGTLAPSGRIDLETVEAEILRLTALWHGSGGGAAEDSLSALGFGPDALDLFDRVQLAEVVRVCRAARSASDAGRTLFSASRSQRRSTNDADRLRKYLARFGLDWVRITSGGAAPPGP